MSTTMAACDCSPSSCATKRRQAHRAIIPTKRAPSHGFAVSPDRHLFFQRQLYEPVDSETLLFYNELKDGQILEEGITEAGSMSSFIAAGTAYANLGVNMIPFYFYYSMFGFQRIGDLIWAAATTKQRIPARRHRRRTR